MFSLTGNGDSHEVMGDVHTRGNQRVSATPRFHPQNSPASVLPDLPAFLGIWRKSYNASARCTSMGDEATCTSENRKTRRMTTSSIYT